MFINVDNIMMIKLGTKRLILFHGDIVLRHENTTYLKESFVVFKIFIKVYELCVAREIIYIKLNYSHDKILYTQ